MDNETFRGLIEAGDLQGLKQALVAEPELANRSVVWFLNQTNESDPLHYVCDCVFNGFIDDTRACELAALLLEHGALIEGTQGRESPLIAAASLGAEAVAKHLIDAGADLEARAVFGAGPLHWAAGMGLPATVELLIQRGAELEARSTEFNATPLFWAVFGASPHGPQNTRDPLGAAKVLIDAGANIDTRNKEGMSAIECSQLADSSAMHQLLLSGRAAKAP